MSQTNETHIEYGQITSDNFTARKSTVTQDILGDINSAVTINKRAGVITTNSASVGAELTTSFTVNNNTCISDSIVIANIQDYSGSAGNPSIYVDTVATGSFVITIVNASSAAALNGTLGISFVIF